MSEQEVKSLEDAKLTKEQKEIKDLFYLSFRFSQGSPDLQNDLLKWLGGKGYFDNIDVPFEPPNYIMQIAVPKKHTEVGGSTNTTFETHWYELCRAKKFKQSFSAHKLLGEILDGMIDRDLHYQELERPNKPRSKQVTPDSNNDPHTSFVRKHIVNSQTTGSDAYDDLHLNLNRLLIKYRTSSSADSKDVLFTQKEFRSLTKEWEKNHPGYSFFAPKNVPSSISAK